MKGTSVPGARVIGSRLARSRTFRLVEAGLRVVNDETRQTRRHEPWITGTFEDVAGGVDSKVADQSEATPQLCASLFDPAVISALCAPPYSSSSPTIQTVCESNPCSLASKLARLSSREDAGTSTIRRTASATNPAPRQVEPNYRRWENSRTRSSISYQGVIRQTTPSSVAVPRTRHVPLFHADAS